MSDTRFARGPPLGIRASDWPDATRTARHPAVLRRLFFLVRDVGHALRTRPASRDSSERLARCDQNSLAPCCVEAVILPCAGCRTRASHEARLSGFERAIGPMRPEQPRALLC